MAGAGTLPRVSDEELETYSLVQLAVGRLRRDILSGRSDPGERLVEEQLTRRLGISRAPLREAMRLLAQQGLVEHIPRRGARVATLSDDDVRELYEVRDVMERHAVASMPAAPDLAGLVLGAIVAFIIGKRFWHVAVFAGAGAVLTFRPDPRREGAVQRRREGHDRRDVRTGQRRGDDAVRLSGHGRARQAVTDLDPAGRGLAHRHRARLRVDRLSTVIQGVGGHNGRVRFDATKG